MADHRELGRCQLNEAVLTDTDLYLREADTVFASWQEDARGATGAAVQRFPGVATAVFPNGPERVVYNNALLERDLAAAERVYAAVGFRDLGRILEFVPARPSHPPGTR